jgi:hypothetical protein
MPGFTRMNCSLPATTGVLFLVVELRLHVGRHLEVAVDGASSLSSSASMRR